MGQAGITTETAQNPANPTGAPVTTASTQTFNTNDDLASDKSGPSGATTVYGYYPTSGTGSTGNGASPGAMKSVKLVSGGITLSETDYAYDPVSGRMNTITIVGENGAPNQVFSISFKSGTNLVSAVAAPGSNTSYQYDPQNGRLTTLGTAKSGGGASVYSASFGYYNDDQRQTETVNRTNADGAADAYQTTYGYDSADELDSVSTSGSGGPLDGSWTYDGVGNRTSFAGTPNDLNQYANYTYNARGDCTSDGTWNYSYDALDRVTAATAVNGSAKVTFGYDAESRLTETDTWTPNGTGGWTLTGTTRYAWDGSKLIGEFDGNNLLRSFAYGPTGLLGITDYTSGSPVTYVPVFDATGSVVELLDTSGNVVADYHYDAWGVRTASGPAAGACPFGFAGMFQDPTTGLYYDDARWYSATQGRFLTRDPSGESGGLNLYAYCGNDPVNEADPTGLQPAEQDDEGNEPEPVNESKPGRTGDYLVDGLQILAEEAEAAARLAQRAAQEAREGAEEAAAAEARAEALARARDLLKQGLGGRITPNEMAELRDLLLQNAGVHEAAEAEFRLQPPDTAVPEEFIEMRLNLERAGFKSQAWQPAQPAPAGPGVYGPPAPPAPQPPPPQVGIEATENPWDSTAFFGGGAPVSNDGLLPGEDFRDEFSETPEGPITRGSAVEAVEEGKLTLRSPGQVGLAEVGGRLGGPQVRAQNSSLATELEDQGFFVTGGGGGIAPEEWIPGPSGGTIGGTFVDITATNGTSVIRIQTIDTLADGVTPTPEEAAAAARIRAAFPNDQLILVPKSK